jgi:NAD-dependent dihydropyrimidine dehydrogenase PreA subunit
MTEKDLIIYCKCIHRDLVSNESREYILKNLLQTGLKVMAVDDLCGLAARHDPLLKAWAQGHKLFIIACYERAIRSLFAMADADLPDDGTVKILNCRTISLEKIMDAVKKGSITESAMNIDNIEYSGKQEPWFPVIDRSRCRSCKLCFNFCLFGVYSVDDKGNVRVSKPDNCKNNCPACARVCPTRAIIFPKIDQSPINGDEVDESKISPSPARLDLLQEEDIYTMLRNRSSRGQRFSPEPGPKTGLLEMLNRELDIPMDVLQALSPADLSRIQKKASSTGEQDA